MAVEKDVFFIHEDDDGDESKVVCAFFGDTIVKTEPEIEFEDLWGVPVLDFGQPNERPAYKEETKDGMKFFETEEDLIKWMGKFSLVMA